MATKATPKEVAFEEVFDRLERNKIINTKTDLAKLLGLSRAAVTYISQKRGSTPPEWERRFEDAGYSWKWVATGEGPMYNNVSIMAQGKLVVAKRLLTDVNGEVVESARDIEMPMHTQYLRTLGVSSDDDISYFVTQGDSMAPTMDTGDICMVDRSVKNIDGSQYFLLHFANSNILGVRKIAILGETVEIRCDNKDYPPTSYDPQTMTVVGRVVAIIKKV